jgi:hypothetical protein
MDLKKMYRIANALNEQVDRPQTSNFDDDDEYENNLQGEAAPVRDIRSKPNNSSQASEKLRQNLKDRMEQNKLRQRKQKQDDSYQKRMDRIGNRTRTEGNTTDITNAQDPVWGIVEGKKEHSLKDLNVAIKQMLDGLKVLRLISKGATNYKSTKDDIDKLEITIKELGRGFSFTAGLK